MQINITYEEFYEKKGASPQFKEILDECVAKKEALKVVLLAGSVHISIVSLRKNQGQLVKVGGVWRSNALQNNYGHPGSLVLLPFLFRLSDLLISYKSMYTFGRDDRTISDFFLRNYFYAVLRRETICLESSVIDLDQSNMRNARDLTLRYLWMIRTALKEEIFSKRDVAELILANAHAPIFTFLNPVLENGIREYRNVARKYKVNDGEEQLRNDFNRIRTRIMQHFEG